MVTQEQKTKWITEARRRECKAIIIAASSNESPFPTYLKNNDVSHKYTQMQEEGYYMIEEIFL